MVVSGLSGFIKNPVIVRVLWFIIRRHSLVNLLFSGDDWLAPDYFALDSVLYAYWSVSGSGLVRYKLGT